MRIFTEHDETKFSILAEFGINRRFTAILVADFEVELNVKVPIPPDELIIAAGYHAVGGERLAPLDEEFYFQAPAGRRFAVAQGAQNKEAVYFPNPEFPEWVVFTFALERLREEIKVETNVNFRDNLEKLKKNVKS
jgi:hypothetical protein